MHLVYSVQAKDFEGGKKYRHPCYFREVERSVVKVTVIGDYPHIVKAYREIGIDVQVIAPKQQAQDFSKLKTEELRKLLTEKGIDFDENAKKTELLKLLQEN